MSDTGEPECAVVMGSGWGCGAIGIDPCAAAGSTELQSGETADTGVLVGHGCATAAGPGWLWVALAWVVAARRIAVVAVCAALAAPAWAIDVENLDPDPGGAWVGLREGDLGAPWELRLGVTQSVQRGPAVLVSGSGERDLVGLLATTTPSVTVNVGRWAQLGLVAPYYPVVVAEGALGAATVGDRSLRLAVPLAASDAATQLTWTVGIETASGAPRRLLGDGGTVWAAGAVDVQFDGGVGLGGQLGLNLRQPVALAGVVWGRSVSYGLGARWDRARWRLAAEALGSVGLEAPSVSTLPLELLGSGRFAASDTFGVRAGVGTGLGRGIGNPAWRVVAGFDVAAPVDRDRDHDRRPDVRDLCPRRAEDVDRFADLEGCPDLDNDRDGFLDPDDACPLDPERVNGWNDGDGCPDQRATLQLVVLGAESATVEVAGDRLQLLGGEVYEVEVDPGTWAVGATAEGYEPFAQQVVAPEGPLRVPVRLVRASVGGVVVTVVDPSGAPVDARIHPSGAPEVPAPAGHARVGGGPGVVSLWVEAPAFVGERVDVDVPRDVDVAVTVVLRPVAVVMIDRQLIVGDKIRFDTDQADPSASGPALDVLARWLLDHPEIVLLRIEGHADEVGSSAYNLALSTRRAVAVRDALVARGVAAERLAPIGSGESLRWQGAAERWVEFLVLVWDDAESAPLLP